MANAGGNALHQQIDRLLQNGTLTGLTDAELLERYFTRRDEVAFEALVRLHGPMVLGLCRRLLHDRQDVEDAFQATFLILVRKAPSLRDRTLLANWLYGVAYRVAIRLRKKTEKRDAGKQPSDRLDEVASDQPDSSDVADWLPILDEELIRLPEKFRRPLVLCYLNGRTQQSAGQLGIPVGTVRSRLARGRDLLKRRLERRGVAPSIVAIALGGSPTKVAFLAIVPGSLVNGTLMSVSRFLSLPTASAALSAGTISAISLAQGVITAMFLTQAKFVTLGVLATAVVGVGVFQGTRTVRAVSGNQDISKAAHQAAHEEKSKVAPQVEELSKGVRKPDDPPDPLAEPDEFAGLNPNDPVEGPVLELKRRLDKLISEIQRTPRMLEEPRPSRIAPMLDLTGFKAQAGMSLPELEAELRIAARHKSISRLHRAASISFLQFDESLAGVQRIIAKLERLKIDLADEGATLKYEVRRKMAERGVEEANVEIAATKVARNERLNQRIKGAVSEEDLAKDKSVHKFADAQKGVVDADIEFLVARSRNLALPMKKVDDLLTEARAIDLSIDPPPSAKPPAR